MLRDEGEDLTRVIVCTPRVEYYRVLDPKAQNIPERADPRKTHTQFQALKSILTDAGCDVIDIPELPGHPNSVFTRDTALVTPEGFIALRMGLPDRKGEDEWMAEILSSLNEPLVGRITEPGTVEGGDVILAGDVAFIGESGRTNREGIEQLRHMLESMGYEIRTARVVGALHLGGLMSAIGPGRLICCSERCPDGFFKGYECVDVPYDGISNGNVICIRENEVIVNVAENRAAAQRLRDRGVKVHPLDLSEFRKGAGGPSCLILPLERNP